MKSLKLILLAGLFAAAFCATGSEALASTDVVCVDSKAKFVNREEGERAGEFKIRFALEKSSIEMFGISVNFDDTIGYSDDTSVSYDEIKKEDSNTFAISAQWKNAEAFLFSLADDSKYVLLLNRENLSSEEEVTSAVRLKSLDTDRSITMKCLAY